MNSLLCAVNLSVLLQRMSTGILFLTTMVLVKIPYKCLWRIETYQMLKVSLIRSKKMNEWLCDCIFFYILWNWVAVPWDFGCVHHENYTSCFIQESIHDTTMKMEVARPRQVNNMNRPHFCVLRCTERVWWGRTEKNILLFLVCIVIYHLIPTQQPF